MEKRWNAVPGRVLRWPGLAAVLVLALALMTLPSLGPVPGSASGSLEAQESPDLGEVDFPVSASGEALRHFREGILWLHSFEYALARQAFRRAQEAGDGFVMAHWGEAMTHHHPIWQRQDRAAARDALERLAPTREERLELAPTQRERDWLRSAEILFGQGPKEVRDQAFEQYMWWLSREYPDDLEARAFHSLAILGTSHGGRDVPTYLRAGRVAEELFQENPRHPGAAHYVIHAYDDPQHAERGLEAARIYAEIAPDAVHALHMPSHIFLALGMWEEVVESNRASAEAARNRGYESHHALHWLHYGLLQLDREDEARRELERVERLARQSGDARSRNHLALMRSAHLVETRGWEEAGALFDDGITGAGSHPRAAEQFARGLADLELGREAAARERLDALRQLARGAGGGPRGNAVRVMADLLEARILVARGDHDEGVERMRRAAEREPGVSLEFGPPLVVKPAHELLGETLLELDRPGEAEAAFREALELQPNRKLSREGLERAGP